MSPLARALFDWLAAFAFTQAVEVPIYLKAGASLRVAFSASALTHPAVWFLFPRLVPSSWWAMVATAELFAIAVEALWLRHSRVARPWRWSIAANLASVSLGLISRSVLGVP